MIAKITAKKEKPKQVKIEKVAEKIEAAETGKEHKEKPLITLKEKKPEKLKKPAEKSDFSLKALKFLDDNKIELLEEMESKRKDFSARIRIESDLGKIEFLAVFKDKKKIGEDDLTVALHKAQSIKLPVLLVSTGEPDKKAQAYLEIWKNMVKFKKM